MVVKNKILFFYRTISQVALGTPNASLAEGELGFERFVIESHIKQINSMKDMISVKTKCKTPWKSFKVFCFLTYSSVRARYGRKRKHLNLRFFKGKENN